jgi:signal transduction histidine kinase
MRPLALPPRPGALVGSAAAAARFSQRLFVAAVFVAVASLVRPLLGYREDLAATREHLATRLASEARVHSQAMGLHFRLLEAELTRLGQRAEVTRAVERDPPGGRPRRSALFNAGIARLDAQAHVLWSDPPGTLGGVEPLLQSDWFQRLIKTEEPVFDLIELRNELFIVAVPMMVEGGMAGAMVGLIENQMTRLPGSQPATRDRLLYLVDPTGEALGAQDLPGWMDRERLIATLHTMALPGAASEAQMEVHGHLLTISPVELTRLYVVLAASYEEALLPVKKRLRLELAFHGGFHLIVTLLFWIVVRASYRSFIKMETRAMEQEKLAALGAAAGLIAHEVKNGLNGIQAAAGLLSKGATSAEPLRVLRGQTARLSHLARTLLQFGGPVSPQRVPLSLRSVVAEALERVRLLPEVEEVDLAFPPPRPEVPESELMVTGDPALLTSAIDNLLRNAIEAAVAAKDTGKIEAARVSVDVTTDASKHARVVIEDNGGGVDTTVAGRLFVPFATGKSKGVGLGLVMAKRAAEAHGGGVWWEPLPGGSRFVLAIPRSDGTSAVPVPRGDAG